MTATSPAPGPAEYACEHEGPERALVALQRTIDTLSRLARAEDFIPAVLHIVADAFGARSCAFCEHPGDTIYLRYWWHEGRVLGPTELPRVDPAHLGAIRRLASGFTAPFSHLGVDLHRRSEPSLIEHRRGEGDLELQDFARSMGWDREMNVPLVVDDAAIGGLVIYRGGDAPFRAADVALGTALGKQLALAMQVAKLAQRERERAQADEASRAAEALAQQREAAERTRTAELAKANEALQQTIDALKSVDNFDDFIPAVLRIVGRTFDGGACALFETRGETITLRYWCVDDVVHAPSQLLALDPVRWGLIRQLAAGFTVPPAYLDGESIPSRTRTIVIDHALGSVRPDFDAFCCEQGWELELNVPILVDGRSVGTLVINRTARRPFSTADVALAEALTAQLALALESSRLSKSARERAVDNARLEEVARSAEERAQLMDQTLSAMRHAADKLADTREAAAVTVEILRAAVDVLATQGVIDTGVVELVERDRRLKFRAFIRRGNEVPLDEPLLAREGSLDDREMAVPWRRISTEPFVWGLTSNESVLHPAWRPLHEAQGAVAVAYVPLVRSGRVIGFVGFSLAQRTEPSSQQKWLLQALTAQISLALEMQRVSDQALAAATAREREVAERDRTAALEHERAAAAEAQLASLRAANDALRRGTERVGQEGGLDALLGAFLLEAMHVSGSSGGGITEWRDRRFRRHIAIAENGTLVHPDVWREEPMIRETAEVLGRDDGGFATLLLSQPVTRSTLAEAWSWWPSAAAYHAKRGHVEVWNVPCGFKGRLLAHLGLAFQEPREMEVMTVSTLTSLAQQMTLALELTDLAERAKQAAVEIETNRAIAAERSRMAGEIHDSLAQSFTSIALQSESLISDLDEHSPLRATLELIEETARLGLSEARSSVLALRPIGDAIGELQNALQQLAERCNIAGSVECEFRTCTDPCPLSADVRDAVLRIAQEAVSNALRHARARRLLIEFDVHDGEARLTVTDDGVGVPELARQRRSGFGIAGMRARAESLGGTMFLTTATATGARGTAVRMRVACDATQRGSS